MASLAEQVADMSQGPVRKQRIANRPNKQYWQARKQTKLGKNQIIVRDQAAKLDEPIQLWRFIVMCEQYMPHLKGKRDIRKQTIDRALRALMRKGVLPAVIKYGMIGPIDPALLAQGTTQPR